MFYLAAAFIVVWVAVTGYVLYMGNRQRQLEQEVEILQEMLQDKKKERLLIRELLAEIFLGTTQRVPGSEEGVHDKYSG